MEEAVKKLEDGGKLWKVREVNKWYERHYKVDKDSMSLQWNTEKWWTYATTSMPLKEIAEIREGWKTDTFNELSSDYGKIKESGGVIDERWSEDKSFSILHGPGGREALDLVAVSEQERDTWVSGLSYLIQYVKSLYEEKHYDVWLKDKFKEADKENNGSLNFKECCTLLHHLNINMDTNHTENLFNQANTNKQNTAGDKVLDVDEFVFFYHALSSMPEIEKLFKEHASKENQLIGAAQLCNFLQDNQGMTNCDQNEAKNIIIKYESSDLKGQGYMTQDGFYHMLQSDMFDIFNHDHQSRVHQDMNQPLSNYFINSSHNTYLTGNQFGDECSVEGYISALKRGCRLLELDVWDGDEGEPVIQHGLLTSKITLADVLKDGVKAYAFKASPYPVIISMENHLGLEQQRVMVKLIKDILGDMVLTEPVSADITTLPSPEALKNKIIVRGKKTGGTEPEDDDEDDDDEDARGSKLKSHKILAPELAQVINILEGKKFESLEKAFKEFKCFNTPSLRETKATSVLNSSPDDFIKFTAKHVTKVYPLATRIYSSNPKPYPFWSVGCQIMAINMQTEDKPNFYNESLFRSNGNCGYVLKPDLLLQKQTNRNTKVVKVTILSGQHLPKSGKKGDIVDPYVQLKVRGHHTDKQSKCTQVIRNNGFNPVWNETLQVSLKVPEVSLIYFSLRDESSFARDPVLGLCCIPFSSLTTGYRFVHFKDLGGKSLAPAALFVHVTINDK